MNTDKKHLHGEDTEEENDLGQFPLGAVGTDDDIEDDDILPLDDDIEDELDPLLAEEDGEEDEGDLY